MKVPSCHSSEKSGIIKFQLQQLVIFHVYIDVNESINLSKVVEMWYFDMPCYPNIHPGQCETAEIATDTFELGRERRNQW